MMATAAASLAPQLASAQNLYIRHATLIAFLDVLLPASEDAPVARALGVAEILRDETEQGSLTERLLAAGTQFLDEVDSVPFTALPRADQEQIVNWLSRADYNEIPGRFYHVIRLFAVGIYYADPRSLMGLPLNDAPQPEGYLPPWETT
jgi:hypothetical protein